MLNLDYLQTHLSNYKVVVIDVLESGTRTMNYYRRTQILPYVRP